jgi:hypothetical protein
VFTPFHKPPYTYPYGRSVDETTTTVMTSPYHFYFVIVPRRTSNWRNVRFGEVVVLKQISVLHHKNS